MASTHKSLRSSTANKRPTTSIADGQIALNTNTTSPGLFFKDSTGATIIKVGPVHVGTTAPNASPAAGGSSGNSTGEVWLDTSLTPNGVKIWNGASWTNATPIGSTTVQGLLELATNAETQTGTDPDRAVTPAGLQSKVSDSTSTTSSTTIASSTAVKSAYDLANAALPKSGGTVTGNLEIGTTGSLSFEGATADAFETTIAVVDPTADRTITLPDTTGTIVTTGDTGTVTSTMIADGTIVNGDINASAAIAGTKISPDFGSQTITTTGVVSAALGAAATPSLTFTGDLNTGIYSPGADQVAISTGGSGRLFVDASGRVGVGTSSFTAGHVFAVTGGYSSLNGLRISGSDINNTIYQTNGIGITTADYLTFSTGGSLAERLRITATGLVGVGTSSPATLLNLNAGINTKAFQIEANNNFNFAIYSGQGGSNNDLVGQIGFDWSTSTKNSYINFYRGASTTGGYMAFTVNNNTEAARIDSSGRLLVGTSTARRVGNTSVQWVSQIEGIGSSSAWGGQSIINNSNDIYAGYFVLGKSRGTTAGSFTIVQSGDELGSIIFAGADGTDIETQGALIKAEVDGTPGINDMPGRLVFSTTADGASSPTARMTIKNDGKVGIGTSSPNYLITANSSTAISALQFINSSTGSTASDGFLVYNNGLNAILSNEEAGDLRLQTGGQQRLTIDSSGRVGIGTSAPQTLLDLSANSETGSNTLRFTDSDTLTVANQQIGKIEFYSADASTPGAGVKAYIGAFAEDTSPDAYLAFATDTTTGTPTERLRITSAGNVGIGTTPTSIFHVKAATNRNFKIDSAGGGGGDLRISALNDADSANVNLQLQGDQLFFAAGGAERARIDSSGRLLVGTSSNNTSFGSGVQIAGTAAEATQLISRYVNSSGGPQLYFAKSRSGTVGTNTIVQVDDQLGFIGFYGANGTSYDGGASIAAFVDATPGASSDMPGRLVFSTTADGASSPTERMRISANGFINAANDGGYFSTGYNSHTFTTSQDNWTEVVHNKNATTSYGTLFEFNTDHNNTTSLFWRCRGGGNTRADLRANGGLANYQANNVNLSDRNVKKDISLAAGTWDCIKEWEIVNYRYKDQPDDADLNLGVIAQQVAESCPEVITVFQEAKDAKPAVFDDDGNEVEPAQEAQPEKLGVKEQQMYWMAIKALQEAQVRIEALEAEVAALKAQ